VKAGGEARGVGKGVELLERVAVALNAADAEVDAEAAADRVADGGRVPDGEAVGLAVRVGDGVTAEEGGREPLAVIVAAAERLALQVTERDPVPVADDDVDADALAVAGGETLPDAEALPEDETLLDTDTVAVTLDDAPALLLPLAELLVLGDSLSDELADGEAEIEPATTAAMRRRREVERGGRRHKGEAAFGRSLRRLRTRDTLHLVATTQIYGWAGAHGDGSRVARLRRARQTRPSRFGGCTQRRKRNSPVCDAVAEVVLERLALGDTEAVDEPAGKREQATGGVDKRRAGRVGAGRGKGSQA
jgi:hypothetical protein